MKGDVTGLQEVELRAEIRDLVAALELARAEGRSARALAIKAEIELWMRLLRD